jgi:hypothetical protein
MVCTGVPQGPILGPLLFLVYINDLPFTWKDTGTPTLFADDTSIIYSYSNSNKFIKELNLAFTVLNIWFANNMLTLKFNKTQFMQFSCKLNNINLSINYNNNHISNTQSIKFLGLILDTNVTWRNHIDYLHTKLGSASYAIRILKSFMPLTTLTNIYFSCFHSIMSYGINFWGNSTHSHFVFKLQKKVIRLITGIGKRDSCRDISKELRILPFYCQYIFSVLLFVIKNNEIFLTNSEIHSICTRHSANLHPPLLPLTKAQKGVYFSAIKIYVLP